MPSAPTRTSAPTRRPSLMSTTTGHVCSSRSHSSANDVTSLPLKTVADVGRWSSKILCNSGRSMTPVKGMLRSSAGVFKSNLAYHSSRTPSLIPFVKLPVQVNLSTMSANMPSSIVFISSMAFDASWIGPPNRRNSLVFSKTWTSTCGSRRSAFARVNPPTPAPAITTLKGRSALISSGHASVSAVVVVVAAEAFVSDDDDLRNAARATTPPPPRGDGDDDDLDDGAEDWSPAATAAHASTAARRSSRR
mmetsp:Transcript_21853/g.70344  ORF Transcript_21853/g.70344 Transcript_21853/m.70344 type:complete len:249 (-) Transcript_21853:38-784(-)